MSEVDYLRQILQEKDKALKSTSQSNESLTRENEELRERVFELNKELCDLKARLVVHQRRDLMGFTIPNRCTITESIMDFEDESTRKGCTTL